MILAAVYCLQNSISFRINSSNANFRLSEGWNDYFLPFFPEDNKWYNKDFNYRPYLNKGNPRKEKWIKRLYCIDYFTQDIWKELSRDTFWQSSISINGTDLRFSFFEICSELTSLSFKFTKSMQLYVQNVKKEINLPKEYIGVHVRRGDKINEIKKFQSVDDYCRLINNCHPKLPIFVSSDDYEVVLQLQDRFKDRKLYFTVKQDETGYIQSYFDQLDLKQKNEQLKIFLTNVDILSSSTHFIGSLKSNVGMFLGMIRGGIKSNYVDAESWSPWYF